jgi:hypothetical protein
MDELDDKQDGIFAPLGEKRWREIAEGTGASELQLRFAALRYSGASQTRAAKIAGYAQGDDPAALRRAGYTAARSTQVQNLLELAAIAAPGDAKISDKEIDAKISKMIRSADGNLSIKAMAIHEQRAAIRKEAEATDFHESPEAVCRDHLSLCRPKMVVLIWAEIWLRNYQWHTPFIRDFVPFLARYHPNEWADYRAMLSGKQNQMKDECDRLERGEVKSLDDLLRTAGIRTEMADAS